MTRFPDISSWKGRFAALACIMVLPFLRFLLQRRYSLFHLDVAVAVVFLAATCLVLSVVARKDPVFWIVALLGILLVSGTPVQRVTDRLLGLSIGWVLGILAVLTVTLMRLLRKDFFHIVLVFALSSFAVDVARFFLPQSVPQASGYSPVINGAHLPHMLYIILDEHIGTGGIPDDLPQGRAAARRIEETFAQYNFQLYPRAFSNYSMTLESIPSILNRRLLENKTAQLNEPETGARWGIYSFRENRLFSECAARGYAIHVYQYHSIDYCTSGLDVQTKTEYSDDLETLNHNRGPWFAHFQWIVGNYQRSDFLLSRFNGLFPFRFRARLVEPLGVAHIWPALLADNIVAADKKTLFFAHLMVPHRPYLYRPDGGIRNITEWLDDDLEPSFDRQTYLNKYRRYFDQLEHVRTDLEWLLQFLKQAGVLDSMLIVIHGDHGSRIRYVQKDLFSGQGRLKRSMLDRYDYVSRPELRDLLNRFSTLLAIRFPKAQAPVMVSEKGSVLRFLNQALYQNENRALPPEADSVYLFDENDRPREIRLIDEWTEE